MTKIKSAAIKITIDDIEKTFTGRSHALALDKMLKELGDLEPDALDNLLDTSEEGFITDTEKFVDRDKALQIANEAQQIRNNLPFKPTTFDSDILK